MYTWYIGAMPLPPQSMVKVRLPSNGYCVSKRGDVREERTHERSSGRHERRRGEEMEEIHWRLHAALTLAHLVEGVAAVGEGEDDEHACRRGKQR